MNLHTATLDAVTDAPPRTSQPKPPQLLRLGDMLVAQGVLTGEQLAAALEVQRRSGRPLGQILIEERVADEQTIAMALAQQLRVPYLALTLDHVVPEIARLLTEAQARRFHALPIAEDGGTVRLAMVDPFDYQAHDEIQRLIKREVEVLVVTEARLNLVLDKLYTRSDQISGLARALEQEVSGAELGDVPTAAITDEAPVARLLQTLFDEAVRARASDIHVEPQEHKLLVRFRIDGALFVHTEAESRIAPAVVQRLKLISGLDIAERRLPQDGRFAVRMRTQTIDMRISTMPTQYGESVVLRLLSQSGGLLNLDRQGLPPNLLAKLRDFIACSQGMLLVTGPTGSGKTTTLYGALSEMNSPEVKIITVEDPVEYRLPGVTQVQVNDKIGLGFATVLRSTLRQDPDIVLVGEMRDQDTVETGLRAAMTGHMVLSTLHTNDAASTPLRLLDMGAPRFLVATSLKLVMAQRLLRSICPDCRRPCRPNAQEMSFLQNYAGECDFGHMAAGRGCSHCSGTGFLGRLGAYELLEMTPRVVAAFNSGDLQAYLDAARLEIGALSLARHACSLVLEGRTTAAEAMRLVGRGVDTD